MSTCYLCGSQIPKGQTVRKRVYTGSSVGGFNLSTNPILNWVLNLGLSNRRTTIRNYYSVRTV